VACKKNLLHNIHEEDDALENTRNLIEAAKIAEFAEMSSEEMESVPDVFSLDDVQSLKEFKVKKNFDIGDDGQHPGMVNRPFSPLLLSHLNDDHSISSQLFESQNNPPAKKKSDKHITAKPETHDSCTQTDPIPTQSPTHKPKKPIKKHLKKSISSNLSENQCPHCQLVSKYISNFIKIYIEVDKLL
jgi:hypothetical protein